MQTARIINANTIESFLTIQTGNGCPHPHVSVGTRNGRPCAVPVSLRLKQAANADGQFTNASVTWSPLAGRKAADAIMVPTIIEEDNTRATKRRLLALIDMEAPDEGVDVLCHTGDLRVVARGRVYNQDRSFRDVPLVVMEPGDVVFVKFESRRSSIVYGQLVVTWLGGEVRVMYRQQWEKLVIRSLAHIAWREHLKKLGQWPLPKEQSETQPAELSAEDKRKAKRAKTFARTTEARADALGLNEFDDSAVIGTFEDNASRAEAGGATFASFGAAQAA